MLLICIISSLQSSSVSARACLCLGIKVHCLRLNERCYPHISNLDGATPSREGVAILKMFCFIEWCIVVQASVPVPVLHTESPYMPSRSASLPYRSNHESAGSASADRAMGECPAVMRVHTMQAQFWTFFRPFWLRLHCIVLNGLDSATCFSHNLSGRLKHSMYISVMQLSFKFSLEIVCHSIEGCRLHRCTHGCQCRQ
jgi:hypothetical protein